MVICNTTWLSPEISCSYSSREVDEQMINLFQFLTSIEVEDNKKERFLYHNVNLSQLLNWI